MKGRDWKIKKKRQNSKKKSKESEITYPCRKYLMSYVHKKCYLLLKNCQELGHSNRHMKKIPLAKKNVRLIFLFKKKKKEGISRGFLPCLSARSNNVLVHVVPTSNYWDTQTSASLCNSQEEQQHCSMFMSVHCFASLRDTSPWG